MLSIAKLQNLKAIHNSVRSCYWLAHVVINRKTTKFESNSQQFELCCVLVKSCYQSQNYKIWKQFTTCGLHLKIVVMLLSIAKLQNLKAIHNGSLVQIKIRVVVINRKTTKFESNSQQTRLIAVPPIRCYQSQNYKIWKQFTTSYVLG